jgi:hypothetical protein
MRHELEGLDREFPAAPQIGDDPVPNFRDGVFVLVQNKPGREVYPGLFPLMRHELEGLDREFPAAPQFEPDLHVGFKLMRYL